jgi:hypothetical protein
MFHARLPAEGLEPTRSCDHWILSPARLPIPPRRLFGILNLQARLRSSSAADLAASAAKQCDPECNTADTNYATSTERHHCSISFANTVMLTTLQSIAAKCSAIVTRFVAKNWRDPTKSAGGKCGARSLPHRCFPLHEIIQRSSSFILNKLDDTCVIDEAEKRGLIRNQIEWVHQIF